MCCGSCGYCDLFKGLTNYDGHFCSLSSMSFVCELAFTLHQITASLHIRQESLECECQVCKIRSQEDHRVPIEGQLRHGRPRELRVISLHTIANSAELVNSLVRQLDHARLRASCSSCWLCSTRGSSRL